MAEPTHITVTAPPGRTTPIDARDGAEPGGAQLRVTEEVVCRVRFRGSQTVRRALARGDLIACNLDGAPVASVDLAAAPDELPGGKLDRRWRVVADRIASAITIAKVDDLADASTRAAGSLKETR